MVCGLEDLLMIYAAAAAGGASPLCHAILSHYSLITGSSMVKVVPLSKVLATRSLP